MADDGADGPSKMMMVSNEVDDGREYDTPAVVENV